MSRKRKTTKNSTNDSSSSIIEYYKNVLMEKVPDALEGRTMDDTYSSGYLLYDEIIGGIPKGRIINIASEPGAGKTTLAVNIISNLLKLYENIIVVYIDTEGSMSYRRLKELGVDIDDEKLLYLQPKTLESAYASMMTILKEKKEMGHDKEIVFCFDSITATPSQLELSSFEDKDSGTNQIGFRARVNSKTLPVINSLLNQTSSTFLMINQLRKNINMGYSSFFTPQEEIVGGLSLLYYSSQDIRLTVKSKFKNLFESQDILGKVVYFKAKKNRLLSPLIEFPMVLNYQKGFDNVLSLFVFLQDLNKSDFQQVGLEGTFYTSGPVYRIVDLKTNEEISFRSTEFVDKYNSDEKFRNTVNRLVITLIRRLYKKYPDDYIYDETEEKIEVLDNNTTVSEPEIEDLLNE
jgi:RecA/RadA recombinase